MCWNSLIFHPVRDAWTYIHRLCMLWVEILVHGTLNQFILNWRWNAWCICISVLENHVWALSCSIYQLSCSSYNHRAFFDFVFTTNSYCGSSPTDELAWWQNANYLICRMGSQSKTSGAEFSTWHFAVSWCGLEKFPSDLDFLHLKHCCRLPSDREVRFEY